MDLESGAKAQGGIYSHHFQKDHAEQRPGALDNNVWGQEKEGGFGGCACGSASTGLAAGLDGKLNCKHNQMIALNDSHTFAAN